MASDILLKKRFVGIVSIYQHSPDLFFWKQIDSGFRREPKVLSTDNKAIIINSALMHLLFLYTGCSGIPCSPPEYYAAEDGAPYMAEEVTVSTKDGHILVGTLTIPKNVNQTLPGVVLITGSSPQNRDYSSNP